MSVEEDIQNPAKVAFWLRNTPRSFAAARELEKAMAISDGYGRAIQQLQDTAAGISLEELQEVAAKFDEMALNETASGPTEGETQ